MNNFEFKVVLLGDCNVGKTSSLNKFCYGNFNENYEKSLISTFYEKIISPNDKIEPIELHMWDTPGRTILLPIIEDTLINSHFCLLFYSINNKLSFESLINWYNLIKKISPNSQIILVENKIDLFKESQVTTEESELLSNRLKIPLFRISVKENINIKPLFNYIITTLYQKQISLQNSLPRGSDLYFIDEFEEIEIIEKNNNQEIIINNEGNCKVI